MSSTSVSEGNVILKYYLYRATGNPGFILPIYILYAIANGVTYTQIGVIGTVQAVIVVGGEIPTGYIGDRIGRRNSLWVGEVLFAISNVTLVFAEGFVWFLTAFSLMSGLIRSSLEVPRRGCTTR